MNSVSIKNLSIQYETMDSTVYAVNDLSFELEKSKTLGLVGETGAGKTTTALSMLGLVPNPVGKIIGGEILVEGHDINNLSEKELEKVRGSVIAMIFQDPMTSLNPVMTVETQVAEAIINHQEVTERESIERAREMLELVGIDSSRGADYPHQFSGGMKQRVIIAMALSCNPKVLIADEPTTALDVTIQAQVLTMMNELKSKYKTSTLMITHDLGVVAQTCDEVAIMYAGNIVEYGDLSDIFRTPKHPYTLGLFGSIPKINTKDEPLKPIKGTMPNPSDLPSGCPFHPRCQYARDICKTEKPRKSFLNDKHYVLCHKEDKGGQYVE